MQNLGRDPLPSLRPRNQTNSSPKPRKSRYQTPLDPPSFTGIQNTLTRIADRLSALTQTLVPSPILLKACRNFEEGQHFDLLI